MGFAAGFALRDRALSSRLKVASSTTKPRQLIDIQSSLRRLEQGVPETESRIGTKLQAQEQHTAPYGQSMTSMITKVDDLKTVFHSPRLRGVFGELQLETLVRDVMPTTYFPTSLQPTLLQNWRMKKHPGVMTSTLILPICIECIFRMLMGSETTPTRLTYTSK